MVQSMVSLESILVYDGRVWSTCFCRETRVWTIRLMTGEFRRIRVLAPIWGVWLPQKGHTNRKWPGGFSSRSLYTLGWNICQVWTEIRVDACDLSGFEPLFPSLLSWIASEGDSLTKLTSLTVHFGDRFQFGHSVSSTKLFLQIL